MKVVQYVKTLKEKYTSLSDNELKSIVSYDISENGTLMDDEIMKLVFQDKECTQVVINTVLERSDLKVVAVDTEHKLLNHNHRNVRLDIYAKDSAGSLYNIEIQKDNRGAIPERARLNSSNMDTHALLKGDKAKDIPTTYVIFITQHDVMGGGFPLYNIDRTIKQMNNALFNDRSHIIYVNGEYKENDTIGRLMQDFQNSVPNTMHNRVLADSLRNLKGGNSKMSLGPAVKVLQERAEARANLATAAKMIKEGLPVSMIQKYTQVTTEKQQELAQTLNTKLVM